MSAPPGGPPLLGAGLYGGYAQPPPAQPQPIGGGSFYLPSTLTDDNELEQEMHAFAGGANACHSNLYVKNIPEDVTEEQLEALFRVYGTVDSCRLVRNLKTNLSRGYGFVRYNTYVPLTIRITCNRRPSLKTFDTVFRSDLLTVLGMSDA
jgi:hypothetical protein